MPVRLDLSGMGSDLPLHQGGRSRFLVRGVTGVAFAAMAAFVLLRTQLYLLPVDPATESAISAVVFVLFGLLAPVSCVVAGVMGPRHERVGWGLLAAGSALMVAGDAVSLASGASSALGAAPSTPVAGLVWLSSYAAFFLAALALIDPAPATLLGRMRRIVDVLMALALVAAFVFAVVLFPAYGAEPGRPLAFGLLGSTSLVLSVALVVIVVGSGSRLRLWHVPLFFALLAVAAGSLLETIAPWAGGVASDSALAAVRDVPWLLAYTMFTLAALVRIRHRGVSLRLQEVRIRPAAPWYAIALMVTAFLALSGFVFLGISWRGDPLGLWVFTGLMALLGLTVVSRNAILMMENVVLREHALADPLTGLYNHRFCKERLAAELARAHREGEPLSLVCMDVDDFDQVNNAYGHAAGDQRLARIAERIVASCRSTDIVCRIGGDEFCLIMPHTTPVEAYKVCLRVQDAVRVVDDGCPLSAGLSMGIAGAPEHGDTRDDLMQRADGALYWAKLHGRGQVIIYDPQLVVSLGPEQRIELLEQESHMRMVQLLAAAVDARDPYTQQHSRRVATYAVALSEAIGIGGQDLADVETAGLLHDIGKIGVADAILRKEGRLTDEEYAQIKLHPELAERILGAIPRREKLLPWISGHHERWDGRGYPLGLAAEEIPLVARILAICDAYDAMTSARPYRAAMPVETALKEIVEGAGTQFDPQLVEPFVRQVRRGLALEMKRAARVEAREPCESVA